jgi:hypothetical protein
MSVADALFGELLSWTPRRLIPQILLALSISIFFYSGTLGWASDFVFIVPLFVGGFLVWGSFSYFLKSIFNETSGEKDKPGSFNMLSFIKGVLEGDRSFASDLKSSDPSMKRIFKFMIFAIAGMIAFYGMLVAGVLALNRIYLVGTSIDLLEKLDSDKVGIALFFAIVSFAISFTMQAQGVEFDSGSSAEAGASDENRIFATNAIRRYFIDNSVNMAREVAPLLRSFLPLISIPTLVKPFSMDSVAGVYRPEGFLKTIGEVKNQGMIAPADQGAYDKLMQTGEEGTGLTDLSVLTGDQLLEATFSIGGDGLKGMNVPRCNFTIIGGGFIGIAAFRACYQVWDPRRAFRTPQMRKTTVFHLLGVGNESAVSRMKSRFKLKLLLMTSQAVPCEE